MTTAPEKADAAVPDTVKTVSLTIDGIQVDVPENTLVIAAVASAMPSITPTVVTETPRTLTK